MSRVALLLTTGLLLLAGCSLSRTEIGRPVPGTDGLAVGRTTKAEALARLGPPRLVQRQFDGDLYTWRRTRTESRSLTILPAYVKAFHWSAAESHRDALSLLFDREGVLRGMGLRRETAEDD